MVWVGMCSCFDLGLILNRKFIELNYVMLTSVFLIC